MTTTPADSAAGTPRRSSRSAIGPNISPTTMASEMGARITFPSARATTSASAPVTIRAKRADTTVTRSNCDPDIDLGTADRLDALTANCFPSGREEYPAGRFVPRRRGLHLRNQFQSDGNFTDATQDHYRHRSGTGRRRRDP